MPVKGWIPMENRFSLRFSLIFTMQHDNMLTRQQSPSFVEGKFNQQTNLFFHAPYKNLISTSIKRLVNFCLSNTRMVI